MKIHISGYDQNQKEYLNQLSEKFSLINQEFTQETEVLVCECVFNQKYNVAKSKNINVVKQEWLIESNRQEQLLDYRDYELKAFNNLKFYFYDLDIDLKYILGQLVVKNQGLIVDTKNNSNYVIVQNQQMEVQNVDSKNIIWVQYYWIQICDHYQQFITPDKFMLVDQNPQRNKVLCVPPQILIKKDLENFDPIDKDSNIFNNFLFYLHPTADKDKYILLKDLINLLGGFYVTNEIKSVTHIIATNLQISELEKYETQQKQFVVHPDYIFNTYAFKTRLIEVNYPPNIIKDKKEDGLKIQYLPFLRSTSQIQEPRFKTFLFKNYLFYLDPEIPNYKDYQIKIIENSGNILVNLQNIQQNLICIQADGERDNFIKKLQQTLTKNGQIYVCNVKQSQKILVGKVWFKQYQQNLNVLLKVFKINAQP